MGDNRKSLVGLGIASHLFILAGTLESLRLQEWRCPLPVTDVIFIREEYEIGNGPKTFLIYYKYRCSLSVFHFVLHANWLPIHAAQRINQLHKSCFFVTSVIVCNIGCVPHVMFLTRYATWNRKRFILSSAQHTIGQMLINASVTDREVRMKRIVIIHKRTTAEVSKVCSSERFGASE
jgi:hypothetical protein